MKFNFGKEGKYFLVPEMPTPNGRVHLGHLAGPYLKMDILKRKIKRGGGEAYLYSGSDVYESYVELKASQLNMTTIEVCNYFHELILNDFNALNIGFDLFINPLDEKWSGSFEEFHKLLAQQLGDNNSIVERDEIFLFDDENDRFINGCWLKGVCQNCNRETGSYLCENCGTHYRPQDIINKDHYPDATVIPGKSLYLKLDVNNILDHLDKMNIGSFKEIFIRYIDLQGPFVRITTPQKTGIYWSWGSVSNQVLYTYTSLLFYSIYCGLIFQKRMGLPKNPFHRSSEFITIASFGIDNAIPYLGGVLGGGLALPDYKPFDYYLSNYFYDLNNQKFSTSRLHVIWGSDIVNLSNIQSDTVRYYLCKVNPEFKKMNFDVFQFIDTINRDLVGIFNKFILDVTNRIELNKEYQLNQELFRQIELAIFVQNENLRPLQFKFSEFVNSVDKWIENYFLSTENSRIENSYWWLKTLIYLAYPVMPEFTGGIWKHLSTSESISADNFFKDNFLNSGIEGTELFRIITFDALLSSLPKTILEANKIL